MPVEDIGEHLEFARRMKEEGSEWCMLCEHWEQSGPERGQCAKSEFEIYRGPGPRRTYSVQRFKVATEHNWSCPKFKRRALD